MASKIQILPILGVLAMLLLISSEVLATGLHGVGVGIGGGLPGVGVSAGLPGVGTGLHGVGGAGLSGAGGGRRWHTRYAVLDAFWCTAFCADQVDL